MVNPTGDLPPPFRIGAGSRRDPNSASHDVDRPDDGTRAGRVSSSAAVDLAATARAIEAVFVGHVRRENELLLPVLADDPEVDLPALLQVMQERFATYRAAAA